MILTQDLLSFDVSLSIYGVSEGSVLLSNPTNSYDRSLVGKAITLSIDTSLISYGLTSPEKNLLKGNKTWFMGIITDVEDVEEVDVAQVKLSVRSFFGRLANKPANTEKFNSTADLVIVDVLNKYAAVPSYLYDVSLAAMPLEASISGGNFIDELRNVAQVGLRYLYVASNGKLVSGEWKDASSSVDYTLPEWAVVSASRITTDEILPTVIKLRGRFVTELQKGEQVLSDEKGGSGSGGKGGKGGRSGGKGSLVKCTTSPGWSKRVSGSISKLKGERPDWAGSKADFGGSGDITLTKWEDHPFGLDFEVEKTLGFPAGDSELPMEVIGTVRPKDEKETSAGEKLPDHGDAEAARAVRAMADALMGSGFGVGPSRRPPAGGGGAPNSKGNRSPDKYADETVEVQVETTVKDSGLFDKFGYVAEQIDNKYVPDKETLFLIGVRRFQEIRMAGNAWRVTTAYLPALELNDVVSFKTPKKLGATQKTIEGVVSSISVSLQTDPYQATMDLVVESFEDLGTNEYVSGNLVRDSKMTGVGSATDWTTNFGTGAKARVGAHRGYIRSTTTGQTAYFQLNQRLMQVGWTYVISFEVEELATGSLDLEFSIFDTLGELENHLVGAGTHTYTFEAREAITRFRWKALSDSGLNAEWQVSKVDLRFTMLG
jgi:hypothetical protein